MSPRENTSDMLRRELYEMQLVIDLGTPGHSGPLCHLLGVVCSPRPLTLRLHMVHVCFQRSQPIKCNLKYILNCTSTNQNGGCVEG